MGSAANSEIPRLGAAAKREGNDVVELQQEAGPAAAPGVRIDVAATAAVAAPHLAPHPCRNVPRSTRPVGRLRTAPGRAGCLWLRPRPAIELRHPCPLRWRRSAATTIRYWQRGGHALVCRRRRPWRRYGGVGPTIGHRLRRGSGGAGRHRHWLGTHRGAAAASLAPRRRRGQRCPRRGAGAARPTRGLLRGPRCHRRGAGAANPARGFLLRTALPAPGCCHRRACPTASAGLRVALARPASLAKSPRPPALPAPSAPAPGPRLPPGASRPRPRRGRPGS